MSVEKAPPEEVSGPRPSSSSPPMASHPGGSFVPESLAAACWTRDGAGVQLTLHQPEAEMPPGFIVGGRQVLYEKKQRKLDVIYDEVGRAGESSLGAPGRAGGLDAEVCRGTRLLAQEAPAILSAPPASAAKAALPPGLRDSALGRTRRWLCPLWTTRLLGGSHVAGTPVGAWTVLTARIDRGRLRALSSRSTFRGRGSSRGLPFPDEPGRPS